jgi:Cof subfamily protein (haloacid dehalogenase superfamily)
MIRLFATDLDGTLVDNQGHIAEEDVAALRRARELGVTVVVATGRIPTIIEHFLDRLEVTDTEPVVGGQGAMVALRNGKILHTLTIPRDVVEDGAALAREMGAVPVYYTTREIVMERVAFSPEEDTYWLGKGLRYDPDPLAHLEGDLVKILAVHPDVSKVEALLRAFRERIGDRAEVVRSHHWFVEAVNKRATKGEAIAWIARELGIQREEVLAIGDADNDVSMLRWAGHSAAPADGAPEARAAAEWIAPPQKDHAVAAALEHFLFSRVGQGAR